MSADPSFYLVSLNLQRFYIYTLLVINWIELPTAYFVIFVINTVVKRFNNTDYKTEHQPTLLSVIGFWTL